MVVTNIEREKTEGYKKKPSKKYIVEIENQPNIYLYYSDIKNLKLEVGMEVNASILEKIEGLLVKRGLKYCYYLLGKKDYTIYEITNKLTKAHYIEAIIDLVILRLSELNLLNDERYATRCYDSYASYKGIKWIKQKLSQKGITFVPNPEETYTEQQINALSKAIKSWLRKHYKDTNETCDHTEVLEYNDFKKLNQYLYQKGFDYTLINAYTTNEQLLEFIAFLR